MTATKRAHPQIVGRWVYLPSGERIPLADFYAQRTAATEPVRRRAGATR